MLKLLPIEVAEAASLEYLGLALEQVERVTAIVEPPMGFVPQYAVVLSVTQPIKPSKLRVGLRELGMAEEEVDGRLVMTSENPSWPQVCLIDKQIVAVATPPMLKRMLDSESGKRSPLTGAVRAGKAESNDIHGALLIQPLKPFINIGLMQAQQSAPPQTHKYFEAVDHLNGLLLSVDLTEGRGSQLNAYANSKADADKLESLINAAVEELRSNSFDSDQFKRLEANPNQVVRAWAGYMKRSFDDRATISDPPGPARRDSCWDVSRPAEKRRSSPARRRPGSCSRCCCRRSRRPVKRPGKRSLVMLKEHRSRRR